MSLSARLYELQFEHLLTLGFFVAIRRHKKRKRRFWLRDRIKKREQFGLYYNLVNELELCEEEFPMYFRLTKQQF